MPLSFFSGQRIVPHGRPDGGYVLFADIQQLRQEKVRAAVAQLSGAVPAQPDVLLRDPTARHTVRSPGAHFHHAAVQPSGVDQDRQDQPGELGPETRRAKGRCFFVNKSDFRRYLLLLLLLVFPVVSARLEKMACRFLARKRTRGSMFFFFFFSAWQRHRKGFICFMIKEIRTYLNTKVKSSPKIKRPCPNGTSRPILFCWHTATGLRSIRFFFFFFFSALCGFKPRPCRYISSS